MLQVQERDSLARAGGEGRKQTGGGVDRSGALPMRAL